MLLIVSCVPSSESNKLTRVGFEIMELEPPESTLVMLETDAASIVGKDWYSRFDKVFINNLGKYRKYKGNSVRDLLRAMRNKVSSRALDTAWIC